MNVRQLRALVEIYETGSLQEASLRMHVTQSALSKTVKDFEAELGLSLLHRTNRGVTLTEGGMLLLGHARQAMAVLRRAQQDVEDFKGQVVSEINIGVTPVTSLLSELNDVLIRFQAEHPHAKVSVHEMRPARLLQGLRDGTLDFALTSQLPSSTLGFEWQLVKSLPSVIVGRTHHPLRNVGSLRLLQHAKWITVDSAADGQSQLRQLFEGNGLPKPALLMECSALRLALQQVATTDSLMITCLVTNEDFSLAVTGLGIQQIQVAEPTPNYPVHLLCLNKEHLTRSAGLFYAMLSNCYVQNV